MTTYTLLAYPARRGADHPTPVRVAEFDTDLEAHAAWSALIRLADQKRLAVYGTPGPSWRMARSIMSVRPTDHPDVVAACEGCTAILAKHGVFKHDLDAYKRWGQLHGYVGNGGGWVSKAGKVIGQGWASALAPRQTAPQYARVIQPGGRDMKFRLVAFLVGRDIWSTIRRTAA